MSSYKNDKMPLVSTPTSLKIAAETNVDEADFDETMVDDSTNVDNTKYSENHGGKKAKLCLRLTEVESLLFFNIIRFNRCPDQVDWDKVAEHSGLKNKSVKVRFRQILNKHGLSNLMPTSHRKTAEVGGQRKGRRTKNKAGGVVGANQDDRDGHSITGPEQQRSDTRNFQLAVPETQIAVPHTQSGTPDPQYALTNLQAQFQAPQSGNGAEPEPARPSSVVNDLGFSPLFALPGPQQQQQQQQPPATTQGGPANIGPLDTFFDPSVALGTNSIDADANANGGTNLAMTATAKQSLERQEQAVKEQLVQWRNQVGNARGVQQMGSRNSMDNMGGTAGLGVGPIDQSAQTNNQYGTNNHGTKRYIKFKFVDDPRPYLGDPNLQVNYSEGHRKWRVETTAPIDHDIGSDYDI